MTSKSFTLKVAALSVAAALSSFAVDLTATVPVDFKANGAAAKAGAYRVAVQAPGAVIVKTKEGKGVAFAFLPVKTAPMASESRLTFSQGKSGAYELSGYCLAGSGCWGSSVAPGAGEKIEVAMMHAR